MAKGDKFSVDETLGEYAKRKKRRQYEEEEAPEPGEEYEEEPPRKKARRPQEPEEYDWRIGKGRERETHETEKISSRLVIFGTYAFRSFAITLMIILMVFVLLHDVFKKKTVPGLSEMFPSPGDSFIGFIADGAIRWLLVLFLGGFFLQAAYYFYYKLAHNKWKSYDRSEIAFSLVTAVVGIVGSLVLLYLFNIF